MNTYNVSPSPPIANEIRDAIDAALVSQEMVPTSVLLNAEALQEFGGEGTAQYGACAIPVMLNEATGAGRILLLIPKPLRFRVVSSGHGSDYSDVVPSR